MEDNRRTIRKILSLEEGEIIDVQDLLSNESDREAEIFQLRTKIEVQLRNKTVEYVCFYCKQPVALRGRSDIYSHSKHFYFTHPYNSDDCIIKTQHNLTLDQIRCIEYNGVKESKLHNDLKNLIGTYLRKDPQINEVIIDEVYKDKAISREWRKPDVLALFPDKKIAFELQLDSTFLTVVVGRTLFYKEMGIYLIWVFPNFNMDSDLQKFTQKDVYYNNNFNVYVFDNEAREKSRVAGELVLTCYYKEFFESAEKLCDRWVKKHITISELNFNKNDISVCYYDSETEKKKVLSQIEIHRRERILRIKREQEEQKIDDAVNYLRNFYRTDQEPSTELTHSTIGLIKTREEVAALNNKLKFNAEKISVVTKLFFERNKPNFLEFICGQDDIHFDTALLKLDGKTAFEEIIDLDNMPVFKKYISCLYRKGYMLSESDKIKYDNLYQKNYANCTKYEKEQIEKWVIIEILSEFKTKNYIPLLLRNEKIFLSIASLKHNMIIGYDFKNIREITHNFLEYRRAFGLLYLKAMKAYGQYDRQLKEDKAGKLKMKIDQYLSNLPRQEQRFDLIFYEVFPELVSQKS